LGDSYEKACKFAFDHHPKFAGKFVAPAITLVVGGSRIADGVLHPVCSWSISVRWFMLEAGIDFKLEVVDLTEKPEWFMEVNPKGTTPAAFVDGEWLCDSKDIRARIKEKFGDRVKGMVDQECALEVEQMEKPLIKHVYGWIKSPVNGESREELLKLLSQLDTALAHGKSLLCGETLSHLDMLLAPVLQLSTSMLLEYKNFNVRNTYSNLDRYLSRVHQFPCFRRCIGDRFKEAMVSKYQANPRSSSPRAGHGPAHSLTSNMPVVAGKAGDCPGSKCPHLVGKIVQPVSNLSVQVRSASSTGQPVTLLRRPTRKQKMLNIITSNRSRAKLSSVAPRPVGQSRGSSSSKWRKSHKSATLSPIQQRWRNATTKVNAVNIMADSPLNRQKRARSAKSPTNRRMKAAVTSSRKVSWSSSGNWYFLLLDMPFMHLGGVVLLLYLFAIMLCAFSLLPIADDLVGDRGDRGEFEVCLWSSATSLITVGLGTYGPASSWTYILTTAHQMLGVVLNVSLFSVVVTKFQRPRADIVFSKDAIFNFRQGQPHLLFRVGNKRCNLIYNPQVIVSMLKQGFTSEGESFVVSHQLDLVQTPSALSGTSTFAHHISHSSPLYEFMAKTHFLEKLKREREREKQAKNGSFPGARDQIDIEHKDEDDEDGDSDWKNMMISVVMSGLDDVYHSEISSMKKYRLRNLIWAERFEDMLHDTRASGGGISFARFDKVVPWERAWPQLPARLHEDDERAGHVGSDAKEREPAPVMYVTKPPPPRKVATCSAKHPKAGEAADTRRVSVNVELCL
jgi:chloride intracellular channel protein 1